MEAVRDPTLPDLVGLPVEGPQVPLKDVPHQHGVHDDLELGGARVRRGRLCAHGVFRVSYRPTLGLQSQLYRGLLLATRPLWLPSLADAGVRRRPPTR